IIQNGWDGADGAKPAFLFLLDAKEKSDQLKKNLADLRKKWVESGKALKTEKILDLEFVLYPLDDKDVPKTVRKLLNSSADEEGFETETNKPKSDLIVGQFESLLIVGNSLKPVEKVMAHATGGAVPALGDLAAYDANRLSLFRDSPFYAWVNVKAVMDIFNRKPNKTDPENASPFSPGSPDKILTASGIGAVKTIAF